MRIGPLRHRITIQKPGYEQDPETGAMKPTWENLAKGVAASIEYLSVREYISAQAGQSEITARIKIRYREGLDSTMRILHKGKIYNMKQPLPDPNSGIEYLTIPVTEGADDGE